jgi:hypothetical protein
MGVKSEGAKSMGVKSEGMQSMGVQSKGVRTSASTRGRTLRILPE